MVCWITTHIRDPLGETVAHADYAELRDGVLLEELADKFLSVAKGKNVAGRPHVGFEHGDRAVDYEDKVPNDAALERGGVFESPVRLKTY